MSNSHLPWTLLSLFALSLFSFVVNVRADYTIDDSNYSVLKFSENPAGPVWGPFGSDTGEELEIRLPNGTMQTINSAQCYDGTFTYAACSTSDNCAVQFSFTGSGITIYVLQAGPQGMSASLSIDGGTATTATLSAPPAPQYNIPHVTLFNVQNIPSGTHTATMTVLDWDGGFSGMMLDYIDVNQAEVASPSSSPPPSPSPTPAPASPSPSPTPTPTSSSQPPTSPSSSPTTGASASPGTTTGSSSASPSAAATSASSGYSTSASSSGGPEIVSVQSSQTSTGSSPGATPNSGNGDGTSSSSSSGTKKTNVGAIIGGAVGGGIGLLALGALAFFCYRRRRGRSPSVDERPSPLLGPGPESRFMTGADSLPAFSSVRGAVATPPLGRPSGGSRPIQAWTESDAASTSNVAPTSSPTNLTHMAVTSSGGEASSPSPAPDSVAPLSTENLHPENAVGVRGVVGPIGGGGILGASQESASLANGTLRPFPAPTTYPSEKAGQANLTPNTLASSQSTQPTGAVPRTNPTLTDDQADFVNSLFQNNVPAPVVARVLERMLANPQGVASGGNTGPNDPELRLHLGAGGWLGGRRSSGFGDGETTIGTAPPSYDFIHAQ